MHVCNASHPLYAFNLWLLFMILQGAYNKNIPPNLLGLLSLVAGFASFALPETTGRQLPETIINITAKGF